MSTPASTTNGNEVAIVGMAGRFPGARTLEEFWHNLRRGVESISFFTDEELAAAGVGPEQMGRPGYVKAGTLLPDADRFDAAFFGVHPREAELMDPQQRVFLELAWEVLESAGYDPERYKGWIGVYAGAAKNTYLLQSLRNPAALPEGLDPLQVVLASEKDYLTTRVAYKLNLQGPSVTVQTACSSSLVAVHMACQSLLAFQCDMALAGGVSVQVPQAAGYLYQEGGYASPDGHCRAFDARAQGTVFGSGAGVVALKRLEDALEDGDTVLAVIRGSAINNDGSRKVGFTAPSVEGQARVIGLAQRVAGVSPEQVQYVEAHGTGTALGDPIEVAALTQAFRRRTQANGFCALGSVKTNFGHLNTASGVAGLIKTVLALRHEEMPPTLHYEGPNPAIDFGTSPFYVNDRLSPWPAGEAPRLAGVSSFGIGGTNAHVVVEEAPAPTPSGPSRPHQLLLLSARTETALDAATARLAAHLADHPEADLADAAYTLRVGRRAFAHRRAVVASAREDAVRALSGDDPGRLLSGEWAEGPRPVAFMFPGGGAQYAGMGRDLYGREAAFREAVDRGAGLLKPVLGLDLREAMYPAAAGEEATRRLERPSLALPALFVTEYAVAKLWMSWGVKPWAMIGHSLGEYTAACLSGVLTYEDALALVALRGRLFERLPEGAMLAVGLPEAELAPWLEQGGLSLAAANGERACVASGPVAEIEALRGRLAAAGIESRRIHIDVAAHSAMVEPLLDEFTRFVSTLRMGEPRIPYLSNVTGGWATAELVRDPAYWARHLRGTVRFGEGAAALLDREACVLLEAGPGQTLSTLVRQQQRSRADRFTAVASLRHPHDARDDQAFVLEALGQLWLSGAEVDWDAFHAGERRRRVALPTYPFERQRYWIDAERAAAPAPAAPAGRREDLADWFHVPVWKQAVPAIAARAAPGGARRFLVLADAEGVGAGLAARLSALGHRVVRATAGRGFARREDGSFELDPRDGDAYAALLRAVDEGGELHTIVHLWTVTGPGASPDEVVDRGFFSLLHLARAIGARGTEEPLGLVVVSSGMRAVTGTERLCPEKATVLGPCRVIPAEYPSVRCHHVDITVPPAESAYQARLLDGLAAEVSADPTAFAVAFREGGRWVQTFDRVPLAPAEAPGPRLRDGGVYLVTGGLGRMGLLLARHLAGAVGAKLVLVGRSGLPDRAGWAAKLAEGDETAERIREVLGVEAVGGEVMIARADVSDAAQMREVVAAAHRRFGAIHGVVHAAMVPGGGTIELRAAEMSAVEFAPKVAGTRVLEEVLAGEPLDFFLLCGSLNAVQGLFGSSGYGAANSFLDAFAHDYAARNPGTYTVAVDWGLWRDVGSARSVQERHRAITGTELEGMSAEEGVEAFARILAHCTAAQVVVSPRGVATFEKPRVALTQAALVQQVANLGFIPATHKRPSLRTAYAAPRGEVESTLAGIWEKVFAIESVGAHDDFSELGGDSLLAIQVTVRAREAFGVELPVRALFEEPTVARLAARVEVAMEEKRLLAGGATPVLAGAGDLDEGEI